MRDKTKQTKIQPHVFKKTIGVELLLCDIVLTLHMHKIHNVADRAASSCTYKNEAFLYIHIKQCYIVIFFISLYFIVIFFSHTFIYLDFNLYTLLLCVLYKRYPYSMCTQSKEAQSCNIMQIYWALLNKTF